MAYIASLEAAYAGDGLGERINGHRDDVAMAADDVAEAKVALKAQPAKMTATDLDPKAVRAVPRCRAPEPADGAAPAGYKAELWLSDRLYAHLGDPDEVRALTRHLLQQPGTVTFSANAVSVAVSRPDQREQPVPWPCWPRTSTPWWRWASLSGSRSWGQPLGRLGTPNNCKLPVVLSSFVGRADELADAVQLLHDRRLVTLVGTPGVGKTRLAVEVASHVSPDYPDGVWLVELASIAHAALVPQTVASVLRIRENPELKALDTLLAELRGERLLLVLDNCEHVVEAAARLAEQLLSACGQLGILATSREPLGLNGECVRRIEPMSTPAATESFDALAGHDAVRLFVDRGASIRAGFALTEEMAPAVGEICRRLDGIPLAIELAAARLEMQSPGEILGHLGERFRRFDLRRHAVPAHHKALWAALDSSYQLLPPPEAALLRRLSVFVRGCSFEDVEVVCIGGEVSPIGLIELLGALVRKSLVSADTSRPVTRYRLLDTVGEYAAHKLQEAGEDAALFERHCSWAVDLAERAEARLSLETDTDWLTRLDAEQDNLRAAYEWALAEKQADAPLRLGAALVLFWWLKGRVREGGQWLERALEADDHADAAVSAKALWGAAFLTEAAGNVAAAIPLAEQSLALAADCHDAGVGARARNLLGLLAMYRSPLEALPLLQRNVAQARREAEGPHLSSSLATIGAAYLRIGDVRAARVHLDECLTLTRTGEDHYTTASVLSALGQAALIEGDFGRAEILLHESLTIAGKLTENGERAGALSWLGELARRRGRYDEAEGLLQEGLALARAMDQPFSVARCLCFLGRVMEAQGDVSEARACFTESLSMARSVGLTYLVARCLLGLAGLSRTEGDLAGAQALAEEAGAVALANGDRQAIGAARFTLANLTRARGPLERAHELCQQALSVQEEIGDLPAIASSLEMLAALRPQDARAVRLFAGAQALRNRGGYERPQAEVDDYRSDLQVARHALSPDEFAQAWSAGCSLSVGEAMAYASRGRGLRQRSDKGWASLTPAEHEVARLAAKGLTNREIGERLFVSPRTAGAHLRWIFTKLGISSRRELAAFDAGSPQEPWVQSAP